MLKVGRKVEVIAGGVYMKKKGIITKITNNGTAFVEGNFNKGGVKGEREFKLEHLYPVPRQLVYLQKGRMLGGQCHWVVIGVDDTVIEKHSWIPGLIGHTLEEAEEWYKNQLEEWERSHRRM